MICLALIFLSCVSVSVDASLNLVEESDGQKRMLSYANKPWEALRIHTHNEYGSSRATATEKVFFDRNVLRVAVDFWERALRVKRETYPIRFARECFIKYTGGGELDGKCQRLKESTTCDDYIIPQEFLASAEECPSRKCSYTDSGPGARADIIVIVRKADPEKCFTEEKEKGTALAYTIVCQRNAWDRPTFAIINHCSISSTLSTDAVELANAVNTMKHELGHALGMDEGSPSLFRNSETGDPLVKRKGGAISGQPPEVQLEKSCFVEGTLVQAKHNSVKNVIGSFAERGASSPCPCLPDSFDAGVCPIFRGEKYHPCVLKLLTPNVVKYAREYFACPTLEGMELENDIVTTPCSIFSPHWEGRILRGELMTSYAMENPADMYISKMTLAYFEDSGWYMPNYTMATPESPAQWGYKMGCDFVKETCLDDNAEPRFPNRFCGTTKDERCNLDQTGTAMCHIVDYAVDIRDPRLRPFPEIPEKGGAIPAMDYCPYIETNYAKSCQMKGDERDGWLDRRNYRGQEYCPHCKCLTTRINMAISNTFEIPVTTARVGCYDFVCTTDGRLMVRIILPGFEKSRRGVHKKDAFIECTEDRVGKETSSWKIPHERSDDNTIVTGGGIICPEIWRFCHDMPLLEWNDAWHKRPGDGGEEDWSDAPGRITPTATSTLPFLLLAIIPPFDFPHL